MTKSLFFLASLVLVSFVVAQEPANTIFQHLQTDPDYSLLVQAISASPQLLDVFNSADADTTLFAPSNQAITAAGLSELPDSLILHHSVGGAILHRGDFVDGDLLIMDDGIYTKVSVNQDQEIRVNGIQLVDGKDMECKKGFVYQVSQVLVAPPSLDQVSEGLGLTTLASLLRLAGMESVLQQPALTLFAPTEAAFAKLPSYTLSYLKSGGVLSNQALKNLLQAHIHSGSALYSTDIPEGESQVDSLFSGYSLDLTKGVAGISLNGANVVTSDILATNGVAHSVDTVLLPEPLPEADETLLELLENLCPKFVAAVKQAGLEDLLSSNTTNHTVFAPTDKAFAVPPTAAALVDLIKYHFSATLMDTITTGLFDSLLEPSTLPNPQKLNLVSVDSGKNATVNGFPVQEPLAASNGVAYLLDHLLVVPPAIPALLASNTSLGDYSPLTEFLNLLEEAQLLNSLNISNLTLWAPTNEAIKDFPEVLLKPLKEQNKLAEVLKYHMSQLDSVFYVTQDGSTTLKTLQGDSAIVVVTDSSVSYDSFNSGDWLNGESVYINAFASNGVVHVIDNVVLPPAYNLGKILNLVGRTDFVTDLKSNGFQNVLNTTTVSYTTLAPSNGALDGQDVTKDLLSYHILDSPLEVWKLLANHGLVNTMLVEKGLAGKTQLVKVANSTDKDGHPVFKVNGVTITDVDIPATNGMAFLLDGVLTPPGDLIHVLEANKDYSTLLDAIKSANLTNAFAGLQASTVFAPTNDAFANLDAAVWGYLLLPNSTADLTKVLTHHVATSGNLIYSPDFSNGQTINTVNGDKLKVTINAKTSGAVVISDANGNATVETFDILASNGVAHGINKVLLPADVEITLEDLLEGYKANKFLQLLKQSNLTELLFTSGGEFTLFAPTDEAFEKAIGIDAILNNATLLNQTLLSHVHRSTILPGDLNVFNKTFTTENPNVMIVVEQVSNKTSGAKTRLALSNNRNISAEVLSYSTAPAAKGYVYQINGVLGQETSKSKSGLSTTAIVLIVVGCIIMVLVLVGVAGGGYYYYQKRSEYTTIEDGSF